MSSACSGGFPLWLYYTNKMSLGFEWTHTAAKVSSIREELEEGQGREESQEGGRVLKSYSIYINVCLAEWCKFSDLGDYS